MAAITVKGRSRFTKKEIKEAAEFLSDYIFKQLSSKIILEVVLIKDKLKKEKAYADLIPLDKDKIPRSFNVEIDDNLSYKLIICSLAHELIHVRQLAGGEQNAEKSPPYLIYQGVLYNEEELHH